MDAKTIKDICVKYKSLISNNMKETEWEELAKDITESLAEEQWISVEERLPEEDELCLVYHKDWGRKTRWFRKILNRFDDIGLSGEHATHWMPLPSPPKGEVK